MPIYALFIEYPLTGHTTVLTFPTRFDRGLEMIVLAPQPVILTPVDYTS